MHSNLSILHRQSKLFNLPLHHAKHHCILRFLRPIMNSAIVLNSKPHPMVSGSQPLRRYKWHSSISTPSQPATPAQITDNRLHSTPPPCSTRSTRSPSVSFYIVYLLVFVSSSSSSLCHGISTTPETPCRSSPTMSYSPQHRPASTSILQPSTPLL